MAHGATALDMARKYVDDLIALEEKTAGLADSFYAAVNKKLNEVDNNKSMTVEEKLASFDVLAKGMEDHARDQIDKSDAWEDGTSLSNASPHYRTYKSNLRGGLKAGLDTRDFKSFSAFRKAKQEASNDGKKGGKKPDNAGSSGSEQSGSSAPDGGTGDNVTQLPDKLLDGLPDDVRNAVHAAVKTLEGLPKDQQMQVAQGFASAASKKARALKAANPAMGKAANA